MRKLRYLLSGLLGCACDRYVSRGQHIHLCFTYMCGWDGGEGAGVESIALWWMDGWRKFRGRRVATERASVSVSVSE